MLTVMHEKMKIKYDIDSNNVETLYGSCYKYVLNWLSKKDRVDKKFNIILEQSLPTILLF
jgi:hypothetical protein